MVGVLPPDFDWKMYRYLNPDLSGFNEIQCKQHYIHHGCYEGRPYRTSNDKNHDDEFYRLYCRYTGVDMPYTYCDIASAEEPVYLTEHDGQLYHVEINFFLPYYHSEVDKNRYPDHMDYIRENYIKICQEKKCCPKCRYQLISFNDMYNITTMINLDLASLSRTVECKMKRGKRFNLVHMLNVGTCTIELIEYLITRIYNVIHSDELLFISTNRMVSEDVILYIKNNVKHDNLLWIENPNNGFDIGQYFISVSVLKSMNIRYEYMIRLHTKSIRTWLDNLINPLISDRQTLDNAITSMKTNDIHYYGSSKYMIQIDCNCFKFLGVKFPGIHHHRNAMFVAGTIFISSRKFDEKVIDVMKPGSYYMFNDKYTKNDKVNELSYPHTIERAFGIINYLHFCKRNLVIVATSLVSQSKFDIAVNNIEMLSKSGVDTIVVLLEQSAQFNDKLVKKFNRSNIIKFYTADSGGITDSSIDEFAMWQRFMASHYQSYINYRKYTFCTNDYMITRPINDFFQSDDRNTLYAMVNSPTPRYHYMTFLFTIGDIRKFINYIDYVSNPNELKIGLYDHFKSSKVDCYIDVVKLGARNVIFDDPLYNTLVDSNKFPIHR